MQGHCPDSAQTPALIALSRDRHATRRWRKPAEYGFARARRVVPLVLAEIDSAASGMPLVFAQGVDGALPHPVALLRLHADTSAYVTEDGRWLAPYIPAILRVYPFSARPTAQSDSDTPARMELLFDEGSGLLTDDTRDARFFDPYGAPSKALDAVIAFFRQYETSATDTQTAMQALSQARTPDGAGLLTPLRHRDTVLSGLLALDRKAFDALDDASFLQLRAAGAIPLAMAHFVSRMQIDWLARAEHALQQQPDGQAHTALPHASGGTTGADISDFLSALATAQHSDMHADFEPASATRKGQT
ncbi:MAG: SapC family protein [Rhodobacteraceae bacterium]|nr:SapC family protein [Paracoccaceae bacterium]